MDINAANLRRLFTAFNAAFNAGLGMAPSQYMQVATVVPSTTGIEEYGWLGDLPGMREWVGDRVVHGLREHDYTIKNLPFELTVAVKRDKIEDDQYGLYSPMMQELGRAGGAHADQLTFSVLKQGRASLCYDKQPFFSATHPVLNASGKPVNQSNLDDSGGGTNYWYVLDTTRVLKPLIFQNRKAPQFVAKTAATDDNVFDRAEYVYGVDARRNVGFGFWQLAFSSNKELNEANLKNAITAMTGRTGDFGRPLGISPNVLVVGPTLEFTARALLANALKDGGGTNELSGRLSILVVPWLA